MSADNWLPAPTWMVDTSRLRETLDSLHTALSSARPAFSAPTAGALIHDGPRVAGSLRDVLAKLDSVDLEATSALSAVVREYRPVAQANRLRDLFGSLQAGLLQRVLTILGQPKIDLATKLLASPAPDLLRILGREDDENSHSDLIAWLLNPRRAPVVAPHALFRLARRLDNTTEWHERLSHAIKADSLSVRREFVIARELAGSDDDLARVDIVVTAPGLVLAIENKVWAREHLAQTRTYWRWMESISGLRSGLFLSPSGLTAVSGDFRAVSYLELVDCLLEGPAHVAIGGSEEIVLGSYLKTLARRIIPVEMRAVKELGRVK